MPTEQRKLRTSYYCLQKVDFVEDHYVVLLYENGVGMRLLLRSRLVRNGGGVRFTFPSRGGVARRATVVYYNCCKKTPRRDQRTNFQNVNRNTEEAA